MASKCKNVMAIVSSILFLALISQILAFSLPGWTRWSSRNDVYRNGTAILFQADRKYTSGLWVQCEDGFKNCDDWAKKSLDVVKAIGECTRDGITTAVSNDRRDCRQYNNVELTMWVTQTLGLFLLALAMLAAILSSVAYCCGGCCGDNCVGFCKFTVLLICMLSSMAITSGLVPFGVQFAEDQHRQQITREGTTFVVNHLQLYYSYGLSAFAAILALIAAITAAFSRTNEGKF